MDHNNQKSIAQYYKMKKISTTNILHAFVLVFITTSIFGIYILLAAQNHFPQIEPMINGTAPRPFVYRVLPSFIIKILSNALGISPYLSAIITMYISLIGFSFSILALAQLFLPPLYVRPITLIAPIGLLPFLIYQRHIYDFPILFVFTLALYYLARNNLGMYILMFTIATLTKETSIFLFIFFLIQFKNMRIKKIILWSIAQIFIYSALRLGIIFLFRNNSGTVMESHLYDHLNMYRQYPEFAAILFFLLFATAGIAILQKEDKTNFLRTSLIAIGGPTFVLYLLSGMPFEMRIFLEAYPSAFLSTALTATAFLDRFLTRSGT